MKSKRIDSCFKLKKK